MWNCNYICRKGEKINHEICQDYCISLQANDINIVAVCDGASSSSNAHIGAKFIAEYVAHYFIDHFDELWSGNSSIQNTILCSLHEDALIGLSAYVEKLGYHSLIKDKHLLREEMLKYCTTIQLIAIKENKALFYKIGNGSAFYIDENHVRLLSASKHEDLTSHFTYPKTVDMLTDSILYKLLLQDSVKGFVIMSDGVDFEDGLFVDDVITEKSLALINGIVDSANNDQKVSFLKDFLDEMSSAQTNVAQDDITVAIILSDDISKVTDISNDLLDNSLDAISIGKTLHTHNVEKINEATGADDISEIYCKTSELKDFCLKIDSKLSIFKSDFEKHEKTIHLMRLILLILGACDLVLLIVVSIILLFL